MVVCHGHGSARERFIVRMGKTLNQALYDERNGRADYTEQLGYALLSVPEGARPLLCPQLQVEPAQGTGEKPPRMKTWLAA